MERGVAGLAPRDPSAIEVFLIEFTRTSEAYWAESEVAKHKQHEKVVKAIQEAGFKVKLMVIQVGVRGGIPGDFTSKLSRVGVLKKVAGLLADKLCVRSAVAGVLSWHTRRQQCASPRNPFKGAPYKVGTKGGQDKGNKGAGMRTRLHTQLPGIEKINPKDSASCYRKTASMLAKMKKEKESARPGGAART